MQNLNAFTYNHNNFSQYCLQGISGWPMSIKTYAGHEIFMPAISRILGGLQRTLK